MKLSEISNTHAYEMMEKRGEEGRGREEKRRRVNENERKGDKSRLAEVRKEEGVKTDEGRIGEAEERGREL